MNPAVFFISSSIKIRGAAGQGYTYSAIYSRVATPGAKMAYTTKPTVRPRRMMAQGHRMKRARFAR
jgi:hypothetical protein